MNMTDAHICPDPNCWHRRVTESGGNLTAAPIPDDSDYGRGYADGLAAGLDELFRRAQRDTKGQPESWAFVAWLVEESRKIKAASDAA